MTRRSWHNPPILTAGPERNLMTPVHRVLAQPTSHLPNRHLGFLRRFDLRTGHQKIYHALVCLNDTRVCQQGAFHLSQPPRRDAGIATLTGSGIT